MVNVFNKYSSCVALKAIEHLNKLFRLSQILEIKQNYWRLVYNYTPQISHFKLFFQVLRTFSLLLVVQNIPKQKTRKD